MTKTLAILLTIFALAANVDRVPGGPVRGATETEIQR